jgi:hypothetical protein
MKKLIFLFSLLFCISLAVSASDNVDTKANYTAAAADVSDGFHATILHVNAIDHGVITTKEIIVKKLIIKDDIYHQQEVEEVLKTHMTKPWKALHCSKHNYLNSYYLKLINLHTRPPSL